jgi:hypothetical protein
MRQSILTAILGTILVGAAGQANAQWRDDRNRDYGYGNGGYGRQGYGYGQNGNVVGRVMRDLEVASRSSGSYVDNHERKHFDRAMSELSQFDQRWQRGQWDNGRLDRAIEDLSHLANANQLNPRARRMMADDANLLREFRASRGNYNRGGSYNPYGTYGPYGR